MNENASDPAAGRYKLHWHVFLTHFPLSLLGVTFLFQVLHLFAYRECFELASTILLVAGVSALVPTTLTGYVTWKRQYKGARASVFYRKIVIALALLTIGVPMSLWRVVYIKSAAEAAHPGIHWSFFIGTALMVVGAILEGYYGGRLSHRPRITFRGNRTGG